MRKELIALREKMREHRFAAYIIPTTDFHDSEYVNDYFKCREYVSGFTGSAGTLVVTMDEAKLWTDGRYFLQAASQLSGSGIDLMKMGQPGVPTIAEYLKATLNTDDILAFDGRVCSASNPFTNDFNTFTECDLVDEIWEDRPPIIPSEIYALSDDITGESSSSKISRVRDFMASKGADHHIISSLEDIAWLYNLRGSDISHTPVFFAYTLLTPSENRLYVMDENFIKNSRFIDASKASVCSPCSDAPTALAGKPLCSQSSKPTDFNVYPYDMFMDDIKKLRGKTMLLDRNTTSYAIINALSDDMKIISDGNPSSLFKAVKNAAEIESTKKAHLKDGAAMVNFLAWLKKNIGKTSMTEISASDYLQMCRYDQKGCYDLSFDTISGYAENGAIIHYSATEVTNKELEPKGLYLVDSGGQYREGTTDITRTVALGPLTEEMKGHYTAVLRSHIALARAVFKPSTTGAQLDDVARKPLHEAGLDYNHGTGHGVGHLLGCHEGPQTISPRGKKYPIAPGMINSNEPGVYIEGSHGIRLENEILCITLSDDPILYGFETLTFCPFEREAIISDQLTDDELSWLNDYHRVVWDNISPLVSGDALEWLREATQEICR